MAAPQSRPINIFANPRDNPRVADSLQFEGLGHSSNHGSLPPRAPVIGSMPVPSYLRTEMPSLELPPSYSERSNAPVYFKMREQEGKACSLPSDFAHMKLVKDSIHSNPTTPTQEPEKDQTFSRTLRAPTLERVPSSSILGYNEGPGSPVKVESGLKQALLKPSNSVSSSFDDDPEIKVNDDQASPELSTSVTALNLLERSSPGSLQSLETQYLEPTTGNGSSRVSVDAATESDSEVPLDDVPFEMEGLE